MLVLAFDTATTACSAALWQDGTILSRRHLVMARGQSEALMPMIAEVMEEAGRAFDQIDLIAVTVGPGTFTGIRIGLAAARGLALALSCPVAGITTTEAVAAGVPAGEREGRAVMVAMESKRDEIWLQRFGPSLEPLDEVHAATPEAAAAMLTHEMVLVGDAAHRVKAELAHASDGGAAAAPDAAVIATLAAKQWQAGQTRPAEPLYLRPADVTIAAKP